MQKNNSTALNFKLLNVRFLLVNFEDRGCVSGKLKVPIFPK